MVIREARFWLLPFTLNGCCTHLSVPLLCSFGDFDLTRKVALVYGFLQYVVAMAILPPRESPLYRIVAEWWLFFGDVVEAYLLILLY